MRFEAFHLVLLFSRDTKRDVRLTWVKRVCNSKKAINYLSGIYRLLIIQFPFSEQS